MPPGSGGASLPADSPEVGRQAGAAPRHGTRCCGPMFINRVALPSSGGVPEGDSPPLAGAWGCPPDSSIHPSGGWVGKPARRRREQRPSYGDHADSPQAQRAPHRHPTRYQAGWRGRFNSSSPRTGTSLRFHCPWTPPRRCPIIAAHLRTDPQMSYTKGGA